MSSQTIPNDSKSDVITFDVLIEGAPIDPAYGVKSISIEKAINRIPSARLVIRDGDAADEKFEISDKEEFVPGKKIDIKLGRDSKNELAFKGIIVSHKVQVLRSGNTNLIIECRDEAVRMSIGRQNKYYEDKKDSEIFEELIAKYSGLTPDVEATKVTHKEVVQHHSTDWDFMLDRADVNGRFVIVDDGKVQVKKPDSSQGELFCLTYGSTIYSYEAEMDCRDQWATVKGSSWDYAGQELFESETSSADFKEHGNITGKKLSEVIELEKYELRHSGHVVSEELEEWVKACMLKSRMAKIRGRVHILTGKIELKPDKVLDIQGIGDRFNGKVYITSVRHDVANGEWDSQVQFGLSPEWFAARENIPDFEAGGTIPSVNGLQIGKVVQLENDPDGEDRILVKLPIIDMEANGIWCRVARLDAGENRGTFWLPEIDDEVLVGFVNDDPRDAIVLGMLHSSTKPAPLEAKDVNHEKGIFTREDLRIHFFDDKKKIRISTPAGNIIELDEENKTIIIEDENKNSIKLSPDGIDMDSSKFINITAKKDINIKSKNGNITLNAKKITADASRTLDLKGGTSKLSAKGNTTIDGKFIFIKP